MGVALLGVALLVGVGAVAVQRQKTQKQTTARPPSRPQQQSGSGFGPIADDISRGIGLAGQLGNLLGFSSGDAFGSGSRDPLGFNDQGTAAATGAAAAAAGAAAGGALGFPGAAGIAGAVAAESDPLGFGG